MKSGLTAIIRARNESLILEDTLKHVLGMADYALFYDDASQDDTAEIASDFDRVTVIRGHHWLADRPAEETRHRKLLLRNVQTEWVLCIDCDERIEGQLPDGGADGFRLRLFDAYMTPEHKEPYTSGKLERLPRLFGPEYRDILMLFRKDAAIYHGKDKREPIVHGDIELADARVRHYGKCLSETHWEETCDYYSQNWPEPYRSKWASRRGKAIHKLSDFGRPLYNWRDVHEHAVKL